MCSRVQVMITAEVKNVIVSTNACVLIELVKDVEIDWPQVHVARPERMEVTLLAWLKKIVWR